MSVLYEFCNASFVRHLPDAISFLAGECVPKMFADSVARLDIRVRVGSFIRRSPSNRLSPSFHNQHAPPLAPHRLPPHQPPRHPRTRVLAGGRGGRRCDKAEGTDRVGVIQRYRKGVESHGAAGVRSEEEWGGSGAGGCTWNCGV
ncbi:hypothetical protein BC938DRAFT_483382, partial [Jimgerdemannia flammicorona]